MISQRGGDQANDQQHEEQLARHLLASGSVGFTVHCSGCETANVYGLVEWAYIRIGPK